MIELSHHDMTLCMEPATGGAISAVRWRGHDILRAQTRPGDVLDAACFPLVPFSNRIAQSRFRWGGERVELPRNHPMDDQCPVLHGVGWLREWSLIGQDDHNAEMLLEHAADRSWPWAMTAKQSVRVKHDSFVIQLALTNCDTRPMPAGLGFHPYFPRDDGTLYHALHQGEWRTDAGCIPTELAQRSAPRDWWEGEPVATRSVDTVYTRRQGDLRVVWPERGIGADIRPSQDLSYTTVYVPAGEDYFCVEPVSHMTDAFNRTDQASGVRVLAPRESWSVSMEIVPFGL